MTPRARAAMLARRRPGVILFVWLFRALSAWLLAEPLTTALVSGGARQLPHGDAALFESGGLLLVEAVRLGQRALGRTLETSAWALLLFGALGLAPLALLLVALATEGKLRAAPTCARAVAHLPALAAVQGVGLLARALAAVAGALAAVAVASLASGRLDERAADLAALGPLALGAVAWLAVGVVVDLASAAAVRREASGRAALLVALRALRRRGFGVTVGWLMPALWSLAAILGGAIATGALHVEEPAGWRIAAVFAVHQAVVVALVALRAVWLAHALRATDPASD
ncbi:MAG: hypothetical protein OZ921_17670 [Sorangiineae bacterium]|nr:hypothetical protein [Polyangiaceae bacterium]MEB2324348.1 hypothetical protein [Sorangiineae bacterium]